MNTAAAVHEDRTYRKFGEYYDLLYGDRDYHAEANRACAAIEEFTGAGSRRVLDLGCGTGAHSILLAERGHHVTGLDRSVEMLARARQKLTGTVASHLEFRLCDVRALASEEEFDASISLFGCMSYLTDAEDLSRTLAGAERALRCGGVFIFDFWNESAVKKANPSTRRKEVRTDDGLILSRTAIPEVDWAARICSLRYQVSVAAGEKVQEAFEETHRIRFFSAEEMASELRHAGFELLRMGPPGGSNLASEDSWFLMAVARRTREARRPASPGVASRTKLQVPQFEPLLGAEELAELQDCIETGWLTEGPKSEQFLARLRAVSGARHAVLAPNGTLALYMALAVCGIGPGDEVIVPDFTFLGSASSVVLTGACPVFVDVDAKTLNLDPESARRALSPRTRAIMPVHIYGQAADMTALLRLAEEADLFVIEDAAQGIGVRCAGRHVGTLGDLGCLSFFADKTITTGEGGAILTDDEDLFDRLQYFRNQGRLNRGSFIHPRMGWNFRLTDLQAGLGLAQLGRLDAIIRRKRDLERMYKARLESVSEIEFPFVPEPDFRVPFRINILVPDPEQLMQRLTEAGVGVRRYFYPLHRQPCFNRENSRTSGPMIHSVAAFDRGLSLPSSAKLTEAQVDYVCNAIHEIFGH